MMLATLLSAVGIIFALMVLMILMDRVYKRFAERYPHLGPFRKRDGGCCSCGGKKSDCGSEPCETERK